MFWLCFPRRNTDSWKKKKREKKAYRVIITVLRAHRGYASFNFTLYSPLPPVSSLSPSLPSLPPFLSPFLSFSVILRGSADSGGMIEEGLLERRGKWSANGTLSPIGHLLTLHSPAAHSVGMCVCVFVCACVCVCVSEREREREREREAVWAIPSPMCAFPQSVHHTFISMQLPVSVVLPVQLIFHLPWFFSSLSSFSAFSLFNCYLSWVLIPTESHQRVTSTFQSSSDHAKPD